MGRDARWVHLRLSFYKAPLTLLIVPEIRSQANDDDDDYDEYDDDVVAEVVVKDERDQYQEYDEPPLSPSSTQGFLQRDTVYDDISPRVSSTKSIVIESEASADVYPIRINSSAFNAVPLSQSESYGQVRHLSDTFLLILELRSFFHPFFSNAHRLTASSWNGRIARLLPTS